MNLVIFGGFQTMAGPGFFFPTELNNPNEKEKTEEEIKEGKKELVVFNPGTVSLSF